MSTIHFDISIGHDDIARAYADDNGGVIIISRADETIRLDETIVDQIAKLAERRAA